jgi:hypothetical protein
VTEILGYGEDSLTLWALKNHVSTILQTFSDKTGPSECLAFYRPSFGRAGGKDSSEFGEFDAIIVSRENVYLIESKWDRDSSSDKERNRPRSVQTLRHEVFSWYLTHWNRGYCGHWENFLKEYGDDLKKTLRKRLPGYDTTLRKNLEFVLSSILEHCRSFSGLENIKNVLLVFHAGNRPTLDVEGFTPICINYSQNATGNFIKVC